MTAAGDDEPFVLLGNAPEEAGTVGNSPPNGAPPEGFEPTAHPAAADGTSPQGVPPEGFEPTAHPAAGGGKVRRVRGLQSSGEQSRFSPKAGTMEGLEHTESAGAVRGSGDTRSPMIRGVSAVWGAVLLAWIGVHFLDQSIAWIWGTFIVTGLFPALGNWRAFRKRAEELAHEDRIARAALRLRVPLVAGNEVLYHASARRPLR